MGWPNGFLHFRDGHQLLTRSLPLRQRQVVLPAGLTANCASEQRRPWALRKWVLQIEQV
jgi:hypothetical protein